MKFFLIALLYSIFSCVSNAQTGVILGKVTSDNAPIAFATVGLIQTSFGATTDSTGNFIIKKIPVGAYVFRCSFVGYDSCERNISLQSGDTLLLTIQLEVNKRMLNEVVVSGATKATLIRENPTAICVISLKNIEQSSQSNIIDVLVKNVPGLNAVKTGPNISKPFIRGLGYNRVLTLYDGIRQEGQQWGDEHGIEVDAYNINKAEVIKGPASLMYGSDALAGVVSLFPFVPSAFDGKLHGKLTSEYQTNNGLIGNGLRLDYSRKHFLCAISGSYRMAKNYSNAIDGVVYLTNFNEKNSSILFGYKTEKGFTHFNATLYDNTQGIPDGSRDSLTRKFTKQIYEGSQDTIANRPIVSEDLLNAYKVPALSQRIQHYRLYTHSFYCVKKGDVDFILGFQQNIRREYNHPTMVKQAGMYVQLNTLNYGVRYDFPKFKNVDASIGVNGMIQSNKSKNATNFPIPDYSLRDGGMYLYVKWKHNKWAISGGVRYDLRYVNWGDFYVNTNVVNGYAEQNVIDTSNVVLLFPAYKKTFQGMTASIGLTCLIAKQISIKVNVGRAYRAPNITEIGSNGLDPGAHIIYLGNRNFNPEFSLQEDFGVSARFDDISVEASVFNNTIQNYIYLTMLVDANGYSITDAQGNKTYQYQQAAAQLYGLEGWLSIHPSKWRGFFFDNSVALTYGFNRNVSFKGKKTNGEYLPLIPPCKLTTSISQKIKFKTKHPFVVSPKLELEYSATQSRYLGLNHTETKTPSYILFNLGFSVEVSSSKGHLLQLVFQVNNLFDTAFQSHLNRLKYFEYYEQSPNGKRGIYNMGRNIGLKIIVPF